MTTVAGLPAGTFAPHMGVTDNASLRADQAKGKAELASQEMTGRVTFLPDTEGMATQPTGPERRIAKVKCPQCGGTCDIHQAKDAASGEFGPDALERLRAFGWVPDGERLFCGQYCQRAYAMQMSRHGGQPIPPVMAIKDQNYARKAYQTAPAQPAPIAATTPAAPPTVSKPSPKR